MEFLTHLMQSNTNTEVDKKNCRLGYLKKL